MCLISFFSKFFHCALVMLLWTFVSGPVFATSAIDGDVVIYAKRKHCLENSNRHVPCQQKPQFLFRGKNLVNMDLGDVITLNVNQLKFSNEQERIAFAHAFYDWLQDLSEAKLLSKEIFSDEFIQWKKTFDRELRHWGPFQENHIGGLEIRSHPTMKNEAFINELNHFMSNPLNCVQQYSHQIQGWEFIYSRQASYCVSVDLSILGFSPVHDNLPEKVSIFLFALIFIGLFVLFVLVFMLKRYFIFNSA